MREFMAPSLAMHTTLRLGGTALAMLEPETEADLSALDARAKQLGGELFFIGRGSNLLAADGELPLTLASMRRWDRIEIIGMEEGQTLVRAGAGVPMARLLRFCLERGLSGLEGLVGIPGTVGGACAMNAGSFGSETGRQLRGLEVWTGGKIEYFGTDKIKFSYRRLELARTATLPLIVNAIFALTGCDKSVILQSMNLKYLEKKSRQPLGDWSAGCAFKNPPGAPAAGQLLEQAGLRGKRLGGMVFSPRHANFLVNEGRGMAAAALELLSLARERVKTRTGVCLEPEIRIIPWALP